MKKKFLSGIFALTLLVTAGYGVNKSMKSDVYLSDLALSNVEALANGEINPMCPNGCYSDGTGCLCHYWFPTYKEAGNN
jgi:hypothetical protein